MTSTINLLGIFNQSIIHAKELHQMKIKDKPMDLEKQLSEELYSAIINGDLGAVRELSETGRIKENNNLEKISRLMEQIKHDGEVFINLMEKEMTPEDIKACEQNEMDKDAIEEAIQKKTEEYLQNPMSLLNDMYFDSNQAWALELRNELLCTIDNDFSSYPIAFSLKKGMLEHARMLAERDLGL